VPISIQYGWVAATISAMAQQYMSYASPGNVTGPKYHAAMNGCIDSSGSGVNYYPGTVAGTLATGGQYG